MTESLREKVQAEHPEMRRAFERGEARLGDVDIARHFTLHELVEEYLCAGARLSAQLSIPRSAAEEQLEQLLAQGLVRHEAVHRIGEDLIDSAFEGVPDESIRQLRELH